MGEALEGGVCGDTWRNPSCNSLSGSFSTSCTVAQLGGGDFDMGNFGSKNKLIKESKINTNTCSDNLIFLSDQMETSLEGLDMLGFGLSPTFSTFDWNNLQNVVGNNEGNNYSLLQDNLDNNPKLNYYEIEENSSYIMVSSNFCNNTNNTSNDFHNQKGASPPMELTTSSDSSSDSSAATCEGGGPTTSFPMNSSASHIIQSLFDESRLLEPQSMTHSHQFIEPSNYESLDTSEGEINALINGYNGQVYSGQYSPRTRSNIRASVLNSLQSRSRGPSSLNKKSHNYVNKVNSEERFMSKNYSTSNDEPSHKRQRIETPSPLPTFKVRKEKIGDRITALQQLVSPFGRTDTASVLHEAIEYIKFLHDQVNVLSTPYSKSGTPIEQQGFDKLKENDEEDKQDLKSRGLCVVPISSTYPVTQETPVDFWTPTFGRTTFS